MTDFNTCKKRKHVTTQLKLNIDDLTITDIVSKVEEKMIHSRKAAMAVLSGMYMGKGVLLYGAGGHGKSYLIKTITDIVGVPLHVKVCNSGSTVEHFLGIPNMKKLTEESKLEYAWKETVFAKPGVVLLEEMLDTRGDVLSSLKDIITEGGLRDGDILHESLSGCYIACTNKSPKEFIESFDSVDRASIQAFVAERFPYQCEVVWDSYKFDDYRSMLQTQDFYKGNEELMDIVALICQEESEYGKFISPRMCVYYAEQAIAMGIDSLETMGVQSKDIEVLKAEVKKKTVHDSLKQYLLALENDLINTKWYENSSPIPMLLNFKTLSAIRADFNKKSFPDEVLQLDIHKRVMNLISTRIENSMRGAIDSVKFQGDGLLKIAQKYGFTEN